MAKQSPSGQLDRVIGGVLGRPDAPLSREEAMRPFDPSFSPIMEMLAALRDLPRPDFKARLKSDLERRASMASSPQPVPEVRATVTPYLSVRGAAAAIDFYKQAFGATELYRLVQPDGRIGHATIDIAGAKIYLADEYPEIGFNSPESLGGSPIVIHLDVADVDAMGRQAVAAGAAVVRPIADQFYGARSGQFRDPFGHTWTLSTPKEAVSPEEMQSRNDQLARQPNAETRRQTERTGTVNYIRSGFHTITPYLIISDAAKWIDFAKQAFDAQEKFRAQGPGTDTIMHAELQIGDSMIELADANPQFPPQPGAIWLRVPDVDASYRRAIEAGAASIHAAADQDYGSRDGSVKDASGNHWYIYTPKPGNEMFAGLRSVTPYLHPVRGSEVIPFLQAAFGAEEIYRAQSPDGVVHHAQVCIGDSMIGMGDAHGPYLPMPCTLHLYVPDTDALYEQALRAGAESIQAPADQPYGDRSAGVRDPFGNRWFIATHLRDVAP